LFPKSFIFDPQVFNGYWIARGYIEVASNQGLERTASNYFNQLMACYYILPAYGDWSLGIMLHDA
jgi:hypothetical protein